LNGFRDCGSGCFPRRAEKSLAPVRHPGLFRGLTDPWSATIIITTHNAFPAREGLDVPSWVMKPNFETPAGMSRRGF
jgi:hypothetical protein